MYRPLILALVLLSACGPAEWFDAGADGGPLLWCPEPGRQSAADPDSGIWVLNDTDGGLVCQIVPMAGEQLELEPVPAGEAVELLVSPCGLPAGDATAVCWPEGEGGRPVGVAAWRFDCSDQVSR
jgi:hypothetical protein